MRPELKNFDWFVYGLDESDFDYTIELIREIMQDRKAHLQKKLDKVVVYGPDGKPVDKQSPDATDAYDDLIYYHHIGNEYLWHFGLWRLQGIFEGILKEKFFPDKKLSGLHRKVQEVVNQGFKIIDTDKENLFEWSKLRNALSHAPPEAYRPLALTEGDLTEYIDLVKRILRSLEDQMDAK
jgi:hypothetical protein